MRAIGQVQPEFDLVYFYTNSVATALHVHVKHCCLGNEVIASVHIFKNKYNWWKNTEKGLRGLLCNVLKGHNRTACWSAHLAAACATHFPLQHSR